jgi:hypothetical protein
MTGRPTSRDQPCHEAIWAPNVPETATQRAQTCGDGTSTSDGGPRRRRDRPELVVIYWRDLPAQVNAQRGRERQQVLLPPRFQRAIERAKRKARIVTAHADVAQWRRESRPCSPDLAAEAAAEAARLEAAYPTERLGAIAGAGGVEPPREDA